MLTQDVRIDTNLNKEVWVNGIRNLPRRVILFIKRLELDLPEELMKKKKVDNIL